MKTKTLYGIIQQLFFISSSISMFLPFKELNYVFWGSFLAIGCLFFGMTIKMKEEQKHD